ncbi:type III toxin-antitoxin system ToxN/AbiQ family toxin [Fusobacterium necrophorum]|uniref:type III toxin-antitoxin system ToxN/AbiQ family toxin n=1 Tax=Fusobacterium necrophorum TaxID=859 RepID=UPI00254F984D|nr:type III toxin-antitoxin system ToxN/AbiQ family toxin [Fusobacterium necrophorum]MDK4494987.1 type III toxin-antitoxin system ToxN/AbiQ family toxin [Fusobacterium necrophorum]
MKRFKFYTVNTDYVKYLREIDNKVTDNSPENNKEKRPYIGILIEIGTFKYIAPLSSKKQKFLKMKNTLDFIKINNGKEGAINLNNMIPVKSSFISEYIVENEKDLKYKELVENQLSWCNEEINKRKIRTNAEKIYKLLQTEKLPKNIRDRCCNFEALEKQCLGYITKLKQEKIEMIKHIIKSNSKNQYNCFMGTQIQIPERENRDNRWIPSSVIEKEGIQLKKGKEPTEGLLCGRDADGLLKIKIVKYYNLSDIVMTKELEQKLVPMREVTQEQEMKIEREQEIDIGL